ncbi:MAG TPA: methyltransferase domain-containing protein [Bacteroidia bacterium]|nr:methyltransferase domain-containing protein [Bacteroidia bacterium]
MNKLNIGSGEFLKEGFINVDFYSVTKPDVEHDLSKFPYPFENDYFELVESDHCFEHLPNPFAVMKEVHRISKNNAKVVIRVPHFSRGFTHAEHKAGFDVTFPYYFKKDFKGGYQGVEFECVKLKLTWFAQPYFKKTVLSRPQFYTAFFLGKVFDFFANLSPFACSRLWCFWVGGFEEVEFNFIVKK